MLEINKKTIFGKEVKIIKNPCNRLGINNCCGGGGGNCCGSLFLQINNYCNSNCFFCIEEKGCEQISDFNKLKKVVNELINQKIISKVVLTGGEPLLHPQFNQFLNLLDSVNLDWYSLNTNGILLKKYVTQINNSKLKHINISVHHYDDVINKKIMGNSITYNSIRDVRELMFKEKEIRLACTITKYLHSKQDIIAYINKAKSIGINNVIFRNEYKGFDKYLTSFRKIWGELFQADICKCGYQLINGVHADYRESNIRLKQQICNAGTYLRDFIYKTDNILSGSWEYGSQNIY